MYQFCQVSNSSRQIFHHKKLIIKRGVNIESRIDFCLFFINKPHILKNNNNAKCDGKKIM